MTPPPSPGAPRSRPRSLAHYDYARLCYSQFFPVEAAWHRLQLLTDAF
jgi:hypothetical protein